MKKRKKITALFLLVLCMVQMIPIGVKADEVYWPEGISVVSESAIVMDMNTGTVLFEKNPDEQNYPASITKIMTTYLAVQNCDMDEVVTFSADAVYKNEGDTSHIARDVGEQMTMEECLYAVMLESANECAWAVAEHVGQKLGGDYSTFIDLMNSTAKDLGCTNTHFNNPNGLPDPDHWTSVRDMALISRAAYQNEEFRKITKTTAYDIPPTNKHADVTYLRNHHAMLFARSTAKYLYEYCTGGKTGFTDAAGNTLVTYAEKDGMALVCVVMKSSNPAHYEDTTALLNYCFNNFHIINISENESSIVKEDAKDKGLLNTNPSFVTLDKNAYVILPKSAEFSDATFELDEENADKGSVASLIYTYGGHRVGKVDLVSTGAKIENNLFDQKKEQQETSDTKVVIVKPIYVVAIIVAVIILIALIIIAKKAIENRYVIRHNRNVKKMRKDRFREVKGNSYKKRKRKDRLFK